MYNSLGLYKIKYSHNPDEGTKMNLIEATKAELAAKEKALADKMKGAEELQADVARLSAALAALTGEAPVAGKGNRRARTPEQKAKLSAALKASWDKRKAEAAK